MVKLTLPLLDNTDNENGNPNDPNCDSTQSIYDTKLCIKDSLFCSDDNPCPSGLPCIDRVCQCLPNKNQFITLTPPPLRMYTLGCHFDTKREVDSCREYEYGVQKTCLLNYCSADVPCYAGSCDTQRHVCTNITASRVPLPDPAMDTIITLGDDPFGHHKEGLSPILVIMMAAGGIVALALVGCIMRTTTHWVKSSVAWASRSKTKDQDQDEKNHDGDLTSGAGANASKQPQLHTEAGPRIMGSPLKFTGSHYLPSPRIVPSNGSSPFATPLASPGLSPYSGRMTPASYHSLSSPFYPRNDSSVSIELDDRSPSVNPFSSVSDNGHPIKVHSSGESIGDKTEILAPAEVRSALAVGPDPALMRSQTMSNSNDNQQRDPSKRSSLYKSRSLQQLGPSSMSPQPRGPARVLSTGVHSPSPFNPNYGPPKIAVTSEAGSSDFSQQAAGNDPRAASPALSFPSLHVLPRQSMLRHSASVPVMQAMPGPAPRNLPAGFASSPVANSIERWEP